MYNEEYDDTEESKSSGNFITNFYYNNKVLIWILIGVIGFILLMSLLTKGGSSNTKKSDYELAIYPPEDVEVSIGNSKRLVATVSDDPNAMIIWTSSNENVVKVDNGNITGINYGKAIITATYNYGNNQKKEVTKEVTVAEGNPNLVLTDVSFKDGDLLMPANSSYAISLNLTPSNGHVTNKEFTSSNDRVVTVDNTGLVQSVGEGEATITLNVNNGTFRKSLRVFVNRDYTKSEIVVNPDKIKFDGELRKMKIGTSEKLSYTVFPEDVDRDRLIWTSSDSNIATVDSNGIVKALKEGRVVVTLKSITGIEDTIDIEVESDIVEVTDINLSLDSVYLTVGQSQTITPTVMPDNASNKALSYVSTDTSVVSISGNDTGTMATLTGLRAGYATVIIKANNNVEKRINVTVTGGSSGGGSSSGSSSSTSGQGFTISSSDANGEKFINATYEATKPKNNGAKAPVSVTLSITDSSIATLRVAVCLYSQIGSCNPSNSGAYAINGTGSFTMNNIGEYVLAIGKYDSNGNHIGTVYKYIWIKEGGSGTSGTSSYACYCRSDGYCTWATSGNSSFPNKNTTYDTETKCNQYVQTTCCHKNGTSYTNSLTVKSNCVDVSHCGGTKTTPTFTLSSNNVTISSTTGSGSFKATSNVIGQFAVSGWDSTCVSVNKSSYDSNLININGKGKSCTTTITVGFNPSDTTRYNKPSNQTVKVTVSGSATTSGTKTTPVINLSKTSVSLSSSSGVTTFTESATVSGTTISGTFTNISSNTSCATVSKSGNTVTVTGKNTSTTSSCTAKITVSFTPSSTSMYNTPSNKTVTVTVPKAGSLYCSPENSPYQREVSASFCNDTYSSYALLKTGAKTKLQSNSYVKYYGCLKTNSGKYNVYECYMK